MAGEQTETKLPTNDELCSWICDGKEASAGQAVPEQIQGWRVYWQELKSFSEKNRLLEQNFNGKTKNTFHSSFWELYLAEAFNSAGVSLKRGGDGQPDFYFERNSEKIWIEAVACGEPQEQNAVPPQTSDFFSGCTSSYENQSMRALASALDSKIKKFNARYKPLIQKERAQYIVALNGWRALNGHPDAVFPNNPPMITRTLFGMGDLRLSHQGQNISQYYEHAKKTKPPQNGVNGAPIAHFLDKGNCDIAGVLYSATNIFETRRDILGHDFIFVQNPYAKDVSALFESLRVKESLDPEAGLKPVPIWWLDLQTGAVSCSTPKERRHGG